jgi:hypothetical protein
MSSIRALKALEKKVSRLTRELGVMQDIHAVRSLHFIYGYYIDMCLYDEAVALFAEDGAARFLNGLYKGRAGVKRLYCDWFRQTFTQGHNGPVFGLLLDHLQLQDVVTIAADRRSARARFRALNMIGYHDSKPEPLEHMPHQFWGGGIYENVYVKEGRAWKIKLLDYVGRWQAPYELGWAHSTGHLPPFERTFPENPIGPDEILPGTPYSWPETSVVAFHYPHPITGKPWVPRETVVVARPRKVRRRRIN